MLLILVLAWHGITIDKYDNFLETVAERKFVLSVVYSLFVFVITFDAVCSCTEWYGTVRCFRIIEFTRLTSSELDNQDHLCLKDQ